jgi:uncharacterized protein (TIGR04255 family)
MGRKMQNAPVYYVLAQVRFNAVLSLEQYMPVIQENMRKAGYPDFERAIFAALNMNVGGIQAALVPAVQQQIRFQFLNEDRTSGFILEQTGMTYQTTEYDTFKPFSEAFLRGLSTMHEAATLSYSERVGIRFLDAVCPKPDEHVSLYLAPPIMGVWDKLENRSLAHAFSEARTVQGKTTLLGRSIILDQQVEGPVYLSPEFQPAILKIAERFSKIKGLYAVLDNDCWVEDREKFDISSLAKQLNSLHHEIERSFALMVTPHAVEAWT